MMNKFDVNIRVPAQDAQSDIILISGVPTNVEAAKEGLAEKVAELEKEKEEKALKSFEVRVEVAPEYHPKIIGRSGGVISKIRTDFDVQIQLPRKDAEEQSIITIHGYEQNANDARDAILKIVGQFESMVHEEVSIDPRVHSMIIGKRGRSIRKIMDDFKVDIRLPREGDEDPSRGPKRPQEGPRGPQSGGEGAKNGSQMLPDLAQVNSKRRLETLREKPKPSKMTTFSIENLILEE